MKKLVHDIMCFRAPKRGGATIRENTVCTKIKLTTRSSLRSYASRFSNSDQLVAVCQNKHLEISHLVRSRTLYFNCFQMQPFPHIGRSWGRMLAVPPKCPDTFVLTYFMKCTHIRSWHPTYEVGAPYGKSWTCHCWHKFIIYSYVLLITFQLIF